MVNRTINPTQITAEQATLSTYQTINGRRQQFDPTQNYMLVNGARIRIGNTLPTSIFGNATSSKDVAPAPIPPHFQFTFDTIGQTIVRAIGDCRLRAYPIWMLGVTESGDESVSNTQTIAFAVCAPIDQSETGEYGKMWDGGTLIFDSTVVAAPVGWSAADAALLATSFAGLVTYPGDQAQLPDSLIVSDKGADKTSAFRGIRYFILPGYPINGGGRGGGNSTPQISLQFGRTGGTTPDDDSGGIAVEFLEGAG